MSVRILAALSIALCVGCASHEGTDTSKGDPKPPTTEPDKPEPAKVVSKASIASVTMIEDCPQHDPPPPPADEEVAPAAPAKPAEAPAQAARRAPPSADISAGDSIDGRGIPSDMCTQSTMQLAFSADGKTPGKVAIKTIRVLDPKSEKPLGNVTARVPTTWTKAGNYEAWDEIVPAGEETKASYRISVPDWTKVEKELGGGSFGASFILEVDLEVDGVSQTIRSPQFPREEPHVVVT